jgi:hypothetical protein
MSTINATPIGYMEKIIAKCLKTSPNWFETDTHRGDTQCSPYYCGLNGGSLQNFSGTLGAGSVCASSSTTCSGLYGKSFTSGIRRSGCRVPF